MKKILLLSLVSMFTIVGCTPSSKQLKEAIEKDPSIVFAAIEKDPAGFIDVVNKAAQEAQEKKASQAAEEETKKREEEFKNPLQPAIDEARAFMGPKTAKVTIVEYSDFECPYCARGHATIKQVMQAYPNDVRILFKHLPLDFHPHAMPAAQYFEAIAMQSAEKAYKFHDVIFENQANLKKGEEALKDAAKKVGADMARLAKDLKDPKIMERINADMEEAKKFGMSGTPGFLINGVSLKGAYPFPEFKSIIDRHLGSK